MFVIRVLNLLCMAFKGSVTLGLLKCFVVGVYALLLAADGRPFLQREKQLGVLSMVPFFNTKGCFHLVWL